MGCLAVGTTAVLNRWPLTKAAKHSLPNFGQGKILFAAVPTGGKPPADPRPDQLALQKV